MSRHSRSARTSYHSGRRNSRGYETSTNWGRIVALVLGAAFFGFVAIISVRVAEAIGDFFEVLFASDVFWGGIIALGAIGLTFLAGSAVVYLRRKWREGNVLTHPGGVTDVYVDGNRTVIGAAQGLPTWQVSSQTGTYLSMLAPETAAMLVEGHAWEAAMQHLADARSAQERTARLAMLIGAIRQLHLPEALESQVVEASRALQPATR